MPIEFSCPHCNRPYKVADANAGKRFACKQCSQPISVPNLAEEEVVPLEFADDEAVPLNFADEGPAVVSAPAPAPPPAAVPHTYAPRGPVMPVPRHGPGSGRYRRRGTTQVTMPSAPAPQGYAPPGQYGAPGAYPAPYAGPQPLSMMALIGLIFAFLGPLALIGVVLSFMGLKETGPRGRKGGRGLAIAGVVLNLLSIAGMIVIGISVALFATAIDGAQKESQAAMQADFDLIKQRIRQYYLANENSLASGGPAQAGSMRGQPIAVLEIGALADDNELKYPRSLNLSASDVYNIEVTGPASVRVSCFFIVEQAVMEITDVPSGSATYDFEPYKRRR